MITHIEAYRYRCFENLSIDLRAYNVLAGANGSGKTTLLDIPVLLGELLGKRTCGEVFLEAPSPDRAPRAHTLQELVFKGRGEYFILVVEAELPEEEQRALLERAPAGMRGDSNRWPTHLRYEVRFEIVNYTSLHVFNEYLFVFPDNKHRPAQSSGMCGEVGRNGKLHRDWRSVIHREGGHPAVFVPEFAGKSKALEFRIPPEQAAFGGLPNDAHQFPAANWFQQFLQEQVVFYDPHWEILRQASRPGLPERVLANGQNLPWLVSQLKEENPDLFSDWVDHVSTALPQVEKIDAIEREEDHFAYLRVQYQGGYEVTSSGLSDGTLQVLALTLLPYLTSPPGVLIVEEPEIGIHPRAIEAVLQSLMSFYDRQVWLSTHSPLVLAQVDLKNVLCARLLGEGRVEMMAGDAHPNLREWQGGIDLGSLFAAGVLG